MDGAVTWFRWHARRALRGAGPAGWLALAMLAGCAGWWLGMHQPALALAEQSQADNDRLDQKIARLGHRRLPPPATPQQQMAQFTHLLPTERELTASVGKLQALAKQQSLQLGQAEFKLSVDSAEPLARYTMTLPLKAGYAPLRRFVHDALAEQPALALEEFSVSRGDARSPLLDARLRFVLFVGEGT